MKYPILRFFVSTHLPEHLGQIAKPFEDLAHAMASLREEETDTETAAGLRKLLEAKDCFVRAALPRERENAGPRGVPAWRDRDQSRGV